MGAFFLMNLTLAIITTKFDEAQKEAAKNDENPDLLVVKVSGKFIPSSFRKR